MYEYETLMRDGNSKKTKLISWPKTLVKKWFKLESKEGDFCGDHANINNIYQGSNKERSSNHTQEEPCNMIIKKSKTEKLSHDHEPRTKGDVQNYRMFVATWNVGGKSPPSHLNLQGWLHTSPDPAHIYVLGFQEIVPLNAGNVLGTEDNGPARKWQALIGKTLNSFPTSDSTCVGKTDYSFPISHSSLSMDSRGITVPRLGSGYSICDRTIYGYGLRDDDGSSDEEDVFVRKQSSSCVSCGGSFRKSRYCLVMSKQMVGLFLMVWIRSDLRDGVGDVSVSCVGRGLMGYLGNKGAISISMCLERTSFCFVCSHLTSGEKDGDELKRNSDVMEILKKTRFPSVHNKRDQGSTTTILDHDRIIWLGDLNYRIALSYRCAKGLVEMCNWRSLLEKDQLRIEQRHGRVFGGWSEGRICFPPTYKYSNNSDRYAGENMHHREKRRTPAWCDRILWHGNGLRQLSYIRGESRFSDHRPVYGLFLAQVESSNLNGIKSTYSSSRVEVEELLPCHHHIHMDMTN